MSVYATHGVDEVHCNKIHHHHANVGVFKVLNGCNGGDK